MTHLAKLTFKTVDRSTKRDPIISRRDKLVAGLKEQKLVHAAALKKEDHRVERPKWIKDEFGEAQLIKRCALCVRGSLSKTVGGMCSAVMGRV